MKGVDEMSKQKIVVRDMQKADEYFVSTCSHVNENMEIDRSGIRRLAWLKKRKKTGLRVKVALLDGEHAGFIYVMPGEICPWGPIGENLMAVPCLWVLKKYNGKSVGKALLDAAEAEARRQGKAALAINTYRWDFWFMPSSYFEGQGYCVAKRRKVTETYEGNKKSVSQREILWKVLKPDAEDLERPRFFKNKYIFKPVKGRVVIDLFYNTFCATSDIEAARVRKVAGEFGGSVLLNVHSADDRDCTCRWGIARGIFINGREISFGYEIPEDEFRKAVSAEIAVIRKRAR